jgi:hypothetical protein
LNSNIEPPEARSSLRLLVNKDGSQDCWRVDGRPDAGDFLQVAGFGSRARSHFPCFVSRSLCPTEIGILCTAHCTPTAGRPGSPLQVAVELTTNTGGGSVERYAYRRARSSFAPGARPMLQVGRLVEVMVAFADGNKWRLPVVPCALGTPPDAEHDARDPSPSKRDFPHGFCAWGDRDQCIPRPRPQPQGILSEGREQRHDQGKQASKRPVLDRPQTRIDESHRARRQLPDSSHHA